MADHPEFKNVKRNSKEMDQLVNQKIADKSLIISTKNFVGTIPTDFGDNFIINLTSVYKAAHFIAVLHTSDHTSDYILIGISHCLSDNDPIDIENVGIIPEFRGRGYCKRLLTYFINQLKNLNKTSITIYNASTTGPPDSPGQPACKCYFSSGEENGYNVYYRRDDEEKSERKLLTYDMCSNCKNINVCKGTLYDYELKQSQGMSKSKMAAIGTGAVLGAGIGDQLLNKGEYLESLTDLFGGKKKKKSKKRKSTKRKKSKKKYKRRTKRKKTKKFK